MKQLLFSLSILASLATHAQNFQVGVNGGLGFNSNPAIISDESWRYAGMERRESGFSALGSVTFLRNAKHWQYGIDAGCRRLAYKMEAIYLQGTQTEHPRAPYSTTNISKVAYTFTASVNRKVVTGNFESYAGLTAGYVLATKCEDPYALAEQYYDKVNGNGFTAGLHLGTTYFFTKRLGINAQLAADYVLLTVGGATYNLFSFPATAGVRYKL